MNVCGIKTSVFKKNDDLFAFILQHVHQIPEGAIVVVSSKIVALSEGRTAPLSQKNTLIKKESLWAKKVSGVWLTEKDGIIMANAGIDESNANGELVLLPKNSFRSASNIRTALKKKLRLKKLGVLITDSSLVPLRAGVTGVALGYAGFKGVRDYRGRKDIFGRKMEISRTNVADSIATAATLVMGEGNERQPLAIVTGAPVEFVEKINKKELQIPAREDIFWPLLRGQNRARKS